MSLPSPRHLAEIVVVSCAVALCLVGVASAADGGNFLLGASNTAASGTRLFQGGNSAAQTQAPPGGVGLWVYGNGYGVFGEAGQASNLPNEAVGVVGVGSDWGGYFDGIDRGVTAVSEGDGAAVTANGGRALQVSGTVHFNAAGLATVPAGKRSVVVTPGVDLTLGTPKVLVTVQSTGGTFQRVAFTGTQQITLYLTANATAPVKLAYFIMS